MSDSCCYTEEEVQKPKKGKPSYFLWTTFIIIVSSYLYHLLGLPEVKYLSMFTHAVFELMNTMSWGLTIGIIMVGLIHHIPKEAIQKVMGKPGTFAGILRATAGGVLLDMCSHGILLVGMQLYRRGLGLGQTMAFLIASPWNSLSLTLILWALIGFKYMIAFLLLSVLIALISGVIFDLLVKKGVLPENPNKVVLPENYSIIKDLKRTIKEHKPTYKTPFNLLINGAHGSKMIIKWLFFGVIIAASLRTFVSPEHFSTAFGPTGVGLLISIIAATVIEVCSEGSAPIAADILTRAGAPGNAFAFLMSGVSNDYTEILALKETTKSWKIAFFLPLVTLPQVIAIALLLN